jgi:hypothetical protein
LKGQELPSCDFCGIKGHTKTACRIKQKAMASAKKETKDRSAQWKKDKAVKFQAFAAADAYFKQDSEETSVKVHCVSNATRIIPRPKDVIGIFQDQICHKM